MRSEVRAAGAGGHGVAAAQAACMERAQLKAGGQGTRGAHPEHLPHVRDAGGVPAGDVRIEVLQAPEELLHVGHGRDAPLGDGAVLRNG
eukprot:scaffold33741_cov63-Phaeocystis_antarctica.AAC.10